MARPKQKARRTAGKVSRKKGSSGKKGEGVAKGKKSSGSVKRSGGASKVNVLRSVGGNSIPTVSRLARLGAPDDRVEPQQFSFPVYGNYCGIGHGDPTGRTTPIDAVDAVCREHDLCYRRRGDFDQRCDHDFIESMPGAIASTPSPLGKKAGVLALMYFSLAERNLALGETLFK